MECRDRLRKSSTSLEVVPKTSEKPGSHLLQKPEISKLLSMNKCKLIVKGGPSRVDRSSNLCTICKTFSSSSYKKLNAHIHECLSLDLPIEPSSKSRVIKPRIKPRKTKLMVDIYATAVHCTLEELDQRHGRIWIEKPVLQEDAVNCDEEKKQSVNGAVCIDGNGTKLLILNKVSDTSSVPNPGANHRNLGILPKWATSKRTGHLKRRFHGDQPSPSEPKLRRNSPSRPKYGHDYKEDLLKYQPTDEDAHQVTPKRSTILKIKKKSSLNRISHIEESIQDHGDLGISPSEGKMVTGNENVMNLAKSSDQHLYSIGERRPSNELGNYFSGIDPISIPGPLGSCLPSPRRTSSYNHHLENSALTSQLQSSLDHLELVDRESMISTASNVPIARSDSERREELSIGPFVPQDEIIKLSFSNKITKSTLGFQDAKGCSLSQKEGNSVNYQDLSTVSVKPCIYGDFGSSGLLSPTSILRLMGKDIMVVNNKGYY